MRQLPCIRPGSQAGRGSPRIKLASRVDGQHEVCSLFGNAWFTSYHTRPGGMRQDVLASYGGETAPVGGGVRRVGGRGNYVRSFG